jgi:hypothetical protein
MAALVTLIILGVLIAFHKPLYDFAVGLWALAICGAVLFFAFLFLRAVLFGS